MNPLKKTALVSGGTGLIGSQLIQFLLNENQYSKVIIILRSDKQTVDPRLERKIINFDFIEEGLKNIMADDVYCCLGSTMKKAGSKGEFRKVDFDYVVNIAGQMKKNGASQFLVVSSMGANTRSMFFYNRVKGEMENALKKLNYPSLHIFRPSLLTGDRDETRTGEKIAEKLFGLFSFLLSGPFKKYRAIESRVVASAMIKTALMNKNGEFIYESNVIQEIG